METQDDIHQLTAAYALDALEPDEAARFEEHLRGCERCREEVAALSEAAGALAYAVDAPPPPADLRERIVTAARGEAGADVVPIRSGRKRRPSFGVGGLAIAASAAAAALVLGLWAAALGRDLSAERDAAAARDAALAIAADPNAVRHTLSGDARGTVVVAEDGRAALIVADLPPAPEGHTYEAWVIEANVPRRAGLFAGGGTIAFTLEERVPEGASIAVTLEPEGGVDAPTGEPVLSTT